MTLFTFTLILKGDAEAHADALFEAGCADAAFGAVDGVHFAEFDREARSFHAALTSAIADVESTPIRVVRVEPDDLVTVAEIAKRLGRTRESVRLLISGARGAGDFPPPVSHARSRARLWRLTDVLDWAEPAAPEQRAAAALVAATNAALELRNQSANLSDEARIALQRLAAA